MYYHFPLFIFSHSKVSQLQDNGYPDSLQSICRTKHIHKYMPFGFESMAYFSDQMTWDLSKKVLLLSFFKAWTEYFYHISCTIDNMLMLDQNIPIMQNSSKFSFQDIILAQITFCHKQLLHIQILIIAKQYQNKWSIKISILMKVKRSNK